MPCSAAPGPSGSVLVKSPSAAPSPNQHPSFIQIGTTFFEQERQILTYIRTMFFQIKYTKDDILL